MSETPTRRALLSVWDKTDLIPFARGLADSGFELISTGGTASALREAGLSVIDVATVTGAPGILDGRVKTLHPAIHGGILARRDLEAHMDTIAALNVPPIDLVAVNLYPFEATIADGAGEEDAIEMIDIGGIALIRAAAKNHASVTVLTAPADYDAVLQALRDGDVSLDLRRQLAAKAFARTAAYDAAIAQWFATVLDEQMPERLNITATLRERLRYGENPHQAAAFYVTDEAHGIGAARQIQGKALSYNNLADADAALELVNAFAEPAVAIIKHANPCGVAIDDDLVRAHAKALACDPVSAFGGIVALNRALDGAIAREITKLFTEVVIAPDADADALEVMAAKSNLRLLLTGTGTTPLDAMQIRSVAGGLLVQQRDSAGLDGLELQVMSKRAPTDAELADLRFAFAVCKYVKSNAIVFAKNGATVGIGAGQMSRLDSVAIAVRKASEVARAAGVSAPATAGSVVASDAFFPFADGLEAALASGATAAIQPGGSMRDDEVIAAADRAGAAMVFTGRRHFRH